MIILKQSLHVKARFLCQVYFEHDVQKIRINVFTLSKMCSKFDNVIMPTCKKIKKKTIEKTNLINE